MNKKVFSAFTFLGFLLAGCNNAIGSIRVGKACSLIDGMTDNEVSKKTYNVEGKVYDTSGWGITLYDESDLDSSGDPKMITATDFNDSELSYYVKGAKTMTIHGHLQRKKQGYNYYYYLTSVNDDMSVVKFTKLDEYGRNVTYKACNTCHGKGHAHVYKEGTCPRCHGSGKERSDIECSTCLGWGYMYTGYCHHCFTSWDANGPGDQTCPNCYRIGTVNKSGLCPECKGASLQDVTCSVCYGKGTGKFDYVEECTKCNGQRFIKS